MERKVLHLPIFLDVFSEALFERESVAGILYGNSMVGEFVGLLALRQAQRPTAVGSTTVLQVQRLAMSSETSRGLKDWQS